MPIIAKEGEKKQFFNVNGTQRNSFGNKNSGKAGNEADKNIN